ncbi:MAG: winged helix-turn-helix transcriptional regulator [Candidatus Thermoplasmatota archaeon]|nr:winged helix-turn-helix transcriptional regulator [Candidatus Thermoplasmatota archaeon]
MLHITNRFIKTMAVLFILINSSVLIASSDYYADLTIKVDTAGFVTIDGYSNYPDLLIENTQMYTFKDQNLWLLNITKNGNFSDFTFTLVLPQGSLINYIKSSANIRIKENQGGLIVEGFGKNANLSILVQYQLEKNIATFETNNNLFNIVLVGIILGLIVLFFIIYYIEKNQKSLIKNKSSNTFNIQNIKGLNDRQKDIMNLLQKSKIPLTQTEIQKELDISKAAVSRNVRRLELKDLIEKEQIGMSNLIRLKKQ